MGDFFKDLENNTNEIHEIGHSIHDSKDLAKKIKEELKGKSKEEIAKKVEQTASNMPDKVQVQNLSKVQSIDKDEIE